MNCSDLTFLDIINCVFSCLTAFGTVGATATSLYLAYRDSHKKLRPSVNPLFSTVPARTLKAIRLKLHNVSNYSIAVNELNLNFHFSTKSNTYDKSYPVLAESLRLVSDTESGGEQKYPLLIKPHTTSEFEIICEGDEIGESIARLSKESSEARLSIEVLDEMGRLSYGKWKQTK